MCRLWCVFLFYYFFYVACSWRGAVIKMNEDTDAKKKEMVPESEDSSVGLWLIFRFLYCKYFLKLQVQRDSVCLLGM